MINLKTFWTLCVKSHNFIEINPMWRAMFYVMASIMFSSAAIWHSRPDMASLSVDFIFNFFVTSFSQFLAALVISCIISRLLTFPLVLVFGIFSEIFWSAFNKFLFGTRFAFVRNSIAFFVIIGAWLFDFASWTNFEFKRFFSGFYNGLIGSGKRDIIAHKIGDVKQGENGETPDRTIPCQAETFKRVLEGVTTRGRAKAVIPPRAPCPNNLLGDEIVYSAWGHAGAADKEPQTKALKSWKYARTTIESRTKNAQNNLTNNNALLMRLQERGNIKTISGGSTILQELFYNDPNTNYANSYSGYEVINISPDSPISAAQFTMKHYADAVTISGPEILQNSGKEQMIELLATRVEIAEARLRNKIDVDLHGDGTLNAGKSIVGLKAMISTTPTTGTYGGIDRSTWAFWQNGADTLTSATAANIQAKMNTVALARVRGTDHIDLIYAGSTAYGLYLSSLQAIQRIADDKLGAAGFSALKFYGGAGTADVILGGGIGGNQDTGRMDFINSKYVHFRPHKDRNFVNIGGDRQSVNQDAVVRLMGWSGALTCSGAQFNAVLTVTV